MLFVVPLSFLCRLYWHFRDWIRYHFFMSPELHAKRVETLRKQILSWNKDGRKKLLRTKRATYLGMSTKLGNLKKDNHCLDFSGMNNILEVDEDKLEILCEPRVSMGQITHLLGPKNLALAVQVEMESITIGGMVMGFGIETTSHRQGLFQETIVGLEVMFANGELRYLTAETDPELFYAVPWSYGSFCFLTAVRVRLERTKPFVRMHYVPTNSLEELQQTWQELSLQHNPPHFLEATVYSKDTAVIQYGHYVDEPKAGEVVNPVGRFYKPWYYKHVETALTNGGFSEVLPVMDYFHRFSKSIFWELEDMIPFGNHWMYRYFWAWLGPPEVSLLKLFQGQVIRKATIYAHVVQESYVPVRKLGESVAKFHEWFNAYPLLVMPLKLVKHSHDGMIAPKEEDLEPGKDYAMYICLGAYGVPQAVREQKFWDPSVNIRAMEDWTRNANGFNALYTDVFMSNKEFRETFNLGLIDAAREKYDAVGAFPTVYEKILPEKGLIPEH